MKPLPLSHLAQHGAGRFPRAAAQRPDTGIKTFCGKQAPWRESGRGKPEVPRGESRFLKRLSLGIRQNASFSAARGSSMPTVFKPGLFSHSERRRDASAPLGINASHHTPSDFGV